MGSLCELQLDLELLLVVAVNCVWPQWTSSCQMQLEVLRHPAVPAQADEELLLLEAVEMYGLGNWPAVAEHVATKSEPDCRAHYYAVYVDVPSFPEPQPRPAMRDVNAAQVLSLGLSDAPVCKACGWYMTCHL